jgi:hypothetical protein
MNEPIEEMIEQYREEKGTINKGKWKPFKTQRVLCKAVDLAGNLVKGDCVECVSHTPHLNGYGKLRIDSKDHWLHRLSWELTNGPIPEGYQIDHICRNRRCINPNHLQLLSLESHTLKTLWEAGKCSTANLLLLKGPELYQVWSRGSFEEAEPDGTH